MDGQERFDGFVFNDDSVFNQHVKAISDIQTLTIVEDWLRHFSLDLQAALAQFVGQTVLISGFE